MENWPGILAEFIEAKRAAPFDWRTNNCAFFACDWLALATGGTDPAAKWRKRCTSAKAAARLLKGGGGIVALAHEAFVAMGWRPIPPAYAQRGDVATIITQDGEALGVVLGEMVAHAGLTGVQLTALSASPRAWRIG